MSKRNVILYIAASLDGYIAAPDDDLSFLEAMALEGEDYGYQAFVESIDTVILGRRTFMWVKNQTGAFPHLDKDTYVISRKIGGSEDGVTYWPGSIRELVDELQSKPGGNIYCDGGAAVVNEMLRTGCIDEIILSVVPVLLGAGIRLFHEGIPTANLALLSSQSFTSGLVQLRYRVIRP
ncbi:MAG: dihydrofolate reductase [Flavobacteriales bacterium]|nr:dihydrofolate reductase [Flavobacteriales bacterium]